MKWSIAIVSILALAVVFVSVDVARSEDACANALESCANNCIGSSDVDACISVCNQAYNICSSGGPSIEPRDGVDPGWFVNCLCPEDETKAVMCHLRTQKEICVDFNAAWRMPGTQFSVGYCGIN